MLHISDLLFFVLTNLFMALFQIADLLFIVLCVPFTALDYYYASVWPFGDTWCK